jgi:hypothetical protein
MIFMTFIFMHSVIICVVLPWRTYETHPALSLKSVCDNFSERHEARREGSSTPPPQDEELDIEIYSLETIQQ